MVESKAARRLTTILSADMAGFSRLMEEDEEGTLDRLKSMRRLIDETVALHRGRVFGSAGDSVMADFDSPVEAVRCSLKMQRDIAARNAALTANQRMSWRIGINLGDVLVDEDNLFGDGVNVAARLQALAPPGGVCVSKAVLDQVRRKVDVHYDDLGDRTVKNIAQPVRVYRLRILGDSDHSEAQAPGASGVGSERDERLTAAREAIGRCAWAEAFELLNQAAAEQALIPEDLELLSDSSWWTSRLDASIESRARAYTIYAARGDKRRAALCCLALAEDYFAKLAQSVAGGWVRRAESLLEGEGECLEHGYLARLHGRIACEGKGDLDGALLQAERAHALARRFGDRNLAMLSQHDMGYALAARGDVAEGMAKMDEAMSAAAGGELDARTTGRLFCNVVDICEKLADYRRAGEWDEVAHRWCERVGNESGFPGICRVKRAVVKRMHGHVAEAEREAERACGELGDFLSFSALAYHELGEARLYRGDLSGADKAFQKSLRLGHDPLPGLARLLMVRGELGAARALLARALERDGVPPLERARLLPTWLEAALAAGNHDDAVGAVADLQAIARTYPSPALKAAALEGEGLVALAQDRAEAAIRILPHASALWRDCGLPYEEARCRLFLAEAYRRTGLSPLAQMEADAARSAFERLEVDPDVAATPALAAGQAGTRAP